MAFSTYPVVHFCGLELPQAPNFVRWHPLLSDPRVHGVLGDARFLHEPRRLLVELEAREDLLVANAAARILNEKPVFAADSKDRDHEIARLAEHL